MDEDAFTLRNTLIGRVQDGELSPDQAEAEAECTGLGRLASAPPADEFDPLQLDRWTLAMAVAWIAWRNPDAVRAHWNDYLAQCSEWISLLTRAGHYLESLKRTSIHVMRLRDLMLEDEGIELQRHLPIEGAVQQLIAALSRGAIEAAGTDTRTGEGRAIPARAWPMLKVTSENGGVDVIRDATHFPYRVLYEHVALPAAEVTRVFPATAALPPEPPPAVPPSGLGYMPLFLAALWLATDGGEAEVSWDPTTWKPAYATLITNIGAGRIELLGSLDGRRERIEPHEVVDCSVVYPFDDHIAHGFKLGEDQVLFSVACAEGGSCGAALGDHLRNWEGPRWTKLLVRGEDVERIWSTVAGGRVAEASSYRTGLPGRPTPAQLLEADMRARAARGELLPTIGRESEALVVRLKQAHPLAPRTTAKTVRNNLGSLYRELRRRPK